MIKVNKDFITKMRKELKVACKKSFCTDVYITFDLSKEYKKLMIRICYNNERHDYETEVEAKGISPAPVIINIHNLQVTDIILQDFILSEEYGIELYKKNRNDFTFTNSETVYWQDCIIFYNKTRTKTAKYEQICWNNNSMINYI